MNFFEFTGMKVSALAAAVPDQLEKNVNYSKNFSEEEIRKFCETTGIWERYVSTEIGVTASDLCVVAANEIFKKLSVDKETIDGIIFLSQSADYPIPPTSCIIQHRLGLTNCGLVFDSNLGCTAFPFGVQMACANLAAGCKRILLLVGDAEVERGWKDAVVKDSLLFGDCGIAAIIERTEDPVPPIQVALHTIGKGYKALMTPYGGARHSVLNIYKERGIEGIEGIFQHGNIMEGADVFTFSITDAPKTAKKFLQHFGRSIEDYDLISIHQANKLIVDNVVKRLKANKAKVAISLDRYGNTRGASTAINICDYVTRNGIHSGSIEIMNLAFGIGLNVAVAGFELELSRCLPIVRTKETFDDGIDNYSYF